MNKSLTSQLALELVLEIQNDLSKNEFSCNKMEYFSAFTWLSSISQKHMFLINELYKKDKITVVKALVGNLVEILLHSKKTSTFLQVETFLIINNIFLILPDVCFNQEIASNLQILIETKIPVKFKKYNSIIDDSIASILNVFIKHGFNPVFKYSSQSDDLFQYILQILKYMKKINITENVFIDFINFLCIIFVNIPVDKRTVIIEDTYSFMSSYFTNHSDVHEKLLKTINDKMQILFDCIISWKSSPDPEHLCLIGLLIPFCEQSLHPSSIKKRGTISNIIHEMLNLKQKKTQAKYSIYYANLELFKAFHLNTNSAFLQEYVTSNIDKFENYLFLIEHKKPVITKEMITDLLPKYLCLKHETEKFNTDLYKFLVNSKSPINSIGILKLCQLIHKNYPKKIDIRSAMDILMKELIERIFNSLDYIKLNENNEEKIENISFLNDLIAYLCENQDLYLCKLMNVSLFSSNSRIRECCIKNMTFQQLIIMIEGFVRFLPECESNNLNNLLFILYSFFNDKELLKIYSKETPEQKKENISGFLLVFLNEIFNLFSTNSKNFYFLTDIYFNFLVWSKNVIEQIPNFKFDETQIQYISKSNILLHCAQNQNVLEIDKILDKIFNNNFKYSFPLDCHLSKDETVMYSMKTIFITWLTMCLNFIKKLDKKIKIPQLCNPIEFQNKSTEKMFSYITSFLCKHINFIFSINNVFKTNENIIDIFFITSFKYLFKINVQNKLFTESFQYLSPSFLHKFIEMAESYINKKYKKNEFSNSYFWINIINMIKYSLNNCFLEQDHIPRYETIMSTLLSFEQFDAFIDMKEEISSSLYSLYTKFFTIELKKTQYFIRASIITLLEILLKLFKEKVNNIVINELVKLLPLVFHDYYSNEEEFYSHLSETSIYKKQKSFFLSLLSTFNFLVDKYPSKTLIINIQKCLYFLLMNNTEFVWKLYVEFGKDSNQIFSAILLKLLTMIFNTEYHSKEINIEEESTKLEGNEGDNLESIYKLSHCHSIKKLEQIKIPKNKTLYNLMKNGKFKIFLNPPSYNFDFMRACISVCIHYGIHDFVFEEITRVFKKRSNYFNDDDNFSLFYGCFFYYLINENWNLEKFLLLAKTSKIDQFIEAFIPNSEFVYYVHVFHEIIEDIDITINFIIKYFIVRIMKEPLNYEISVDVTKMEFDEIDFAKSLKSSKKFRKLVISFLKSETFYPILQTNTFHTDKLIIYKYVSTKPSVIDVINRNRESMAEELNIKKPKYEEILQLKNDKHWISKIKAKSQFKYYYIELELIPPNLSFETMVYDFYSHFSVSDKEIILIIEATYVQIQVFDKILRLIKQMDESFINNIKEINLMNPNSIITNHIKRSINTDIINKIKIINNADELLKNQQIYLPSSAYTEITNCRGSFNVKTGGMDSILNIGDGCFVLNTAFSFYNFHFMHSREIPLNKILNLGCIENFIVLNVTQSGSSFKVKLFSPFSNYIKNVYESMKQRKELIVNNEEIDIYSSCHVMCIALAIFILSSDKKKLYPHAVQLFEAAIRNGNTLINCDIVCFEFISRHLDSFFKEIQTANLINEVVISLIDFFIYPLHPDNATTKTFELICNLLPLFMMFINSSNNKFYTFKIIKLFLNLFCKTKTQSLIDFTMNKIESKFAIECSLQFILTSDKSITIQKKAINFLMEKNPNYVCELFLYNYLDGIINRRSFCDKVNIGNIMDIMASFPFLAPTFANKNLKQIMLCAIFVGCQESKEITDYVKTFIGLIFKTISSIHQNVDINKYLNKFCELIEESKIISIFELVDLGEKIISEVNQREYGSLTRMIMNEESWRNIDNWYLNAAIFAQNSNNKEKIKKIAKKYISIMSAMLNSKNGILKLSLMFTTFNNIIDKINPSSQIIQILFWNSIFGANHSFTTLRNSSITLLTKIITKVYQINKDFDFYHEFSVTDNASQCISFFSEYMNINFTNDFDFALMFSLSKSFQELESRNTALNLMKELINISFSQKKVPSVFVLPFIGYCNDDYSWILKMKFNDKKFKSFPELIFSNFNEKDNIEIFNIIYYLKNIFGDRHCSHKLSEISECLIYGVLNYPDKFIIIKDQIQEKCMKLFDMETVISRIDIITKVLSNYMNCGIPLKTNNNNKFDLSIKECDDEILLTYINGFTYSAKNKYEN